jgi:SAM-dependent methyltransferase
VAAAAVFGAVAGAYATARPDYPPQLYTVLAGLAGRSLDGAVVADVGAGTGIAARQLRDLGAHVIAIEPSAGMIAELAGASPGVHVVAGDGNALPLRGACADFVTYAQAWHWTDPRRAVPEYRRVLRPGGTFAAWWNLTARQAPWEVAQEQRLIAACPSYRAGRDRYPGFGERADPAALSLGLPARIAEFAWSRRVAIDVHLANLNSKSYVAALGRGGAARFLAAERAALTVALPGGMVTEDYRTVLAVVRPDRRAGL